MFSKIFNFFKIPLDNHKFCDYISHMKRHKDKKSKDATCKAIRIDVPTQVNDALIAGARKESTRLSLRISKQAFLGQLLKKFADGEVEIKGSLFLFL